jgi:hypothetical protein
MFPFKAPFLEISDCHGMPWLWLREGHPPSLHVSWLTESLWHVACRGLWGKAQNRRSMKPKQVPVPGGPRGLPESPRISIESLRRVGEINGKTVGNHHQFFVKVSCLMVSRFQDGFKLVQIVWRCWKNHGMIGWDDFGLFFGDLNHQKAIGKHGSILLGMGKTCLIN